MKYCYCPNQHGKRIASDCEECGGVVTVNVKSKPKRGGARKGAGRKPGVKKARNKIARSITLHRDTWQMIEKKRKELSPSKFIEMKIK